MSKILPQVVIEGIKSFNETIHLTIPTQANNPFQLYADFGTLRWLAVSDLLQWDAKGQKVLIPLVDSSRFNCWGEAIVCTKLNDPSDPTFISEVANKKAEYELEIQKEK